MNEYKWMLRLEQIAFFVACVLIWPYTELSYYWFFGMLLLPDLGMFGYLHSPRLGAYTYNFTHHQGLAICCLVIGWLQPAIPYVFSLGVLLLAHSAMDRALGYGLKSVTGFKQTHLGEIGG